MYFRGNLLHCWNCHTHFMQPEILQETLCPLAVWEGHQGSTKPIKVSSGLGWDNQVPWSLALQEALIQTFPKLWGRLEASLSFLSYSFWGWEVREQNINCISHITPAYLKQPPALPYTAGQTSPKLIKAYQTSERLISGTLWMNFQVPPWSKKCKWF